MFIIWFCRSFCTYVRSFPHNVRNKEVRILIDYYWFLFHYITFPRKNGLNSLFFSVIRRKIFKQVCSYNRKASTPKKSFRNYFIPGQAGNPQTFWQKSFLTKTSSPILLRHNFTVVRPGSFTVTAFALRAVCNPLYRLSQTTIYGTR